MSAKRISDETTVFTYGDLACEGVTIPPADVYAAPSRAAYCAPVKKEREHRFPVHLVFLLGALCAAALLVLTLMGQIHLTKLNDRTVEAETVLGQLRETNRLLQIRAEEHGEFELVPDDAAETPVDTATVLHVRLGSRLTEGWDLIVDTVKECFH